MQFSGAMSAIKSFVFHKLELPSRMFPQWYQNWNGTEKGIKQWWEKYIPQTTSRERPEIGLKDVENEWESFAKLGVRILNILDPRYPALLSEVYDPPAVLFLRGDTRLLQRPSLSVVGAREVLPWVRKWLTTELSLFHKDYPSVVGVSGGARGVDICSHHTAVASGAGTIVVLPSGVLRPYPKQVASLKATAGKSKLLWVSEYHPLQEIRKHHFYKRNRIITGLSPHLFVAQAAQKSGSMMTARLALENNRGIYCLPMTPYDQQGAGNLKLLQEGAGLIRHSRDLGDILSGTTQSTFDI